MSRSPDATATRAGGRHGKPWRAAGTVVVVLLALAGVGMIGASMTTASAPRPPQPLAQAGPEPSQLAEADQPAEGDPAPTGLPRATPTTIAIPRIGVDAQLMSLGTNPDGTVQVPPLEQADRAGWYEPGPSPGEVGNAVIVGHVDSAAMGPAVFFDLGAMQPGDTVTVNRSDGRPATFRVDSVKSYPKDQFPTELVYGPSERPGLRVVTCGGQFDETARSYLNNVIVFASLVG
ncbi:class F sortase [Micromonospora musae]|uniref:Class F sortase n=1 Tax=Micromonospora musae TaxID=1894970 RepID=A0A3A9Y6V2_9ACTN|nr:class F sortase [Micromonospora musae]RKN33058.1 class F sortase [Micromonospora musae]